MVFITYEKMQQKDMRGKQNFMINWKKQIKFFNSYFRLFWIFIPLLMLLFAGILIRLLARNFFDNPVIVTRVVPLMVSEHPFPAVSICATNVIIESKVDKFISKLYVSSSLSGNMFKYLLFSTKFVIYCSFGCFMIISWNILAKLQQIIQKNGFDKLLKCWLYLHVARHIKVYKKMPVLSTNC